jgi:hypothetical protein
MFTTFRSIDANRTLTTLKHRLQPRSVAASVAAPAIMIPLSAAAAIAAYGFYLRLW